MGSVGNGDFGFVQSNGILPPCSNFASGSVLLGSFPETNMEITACSNASASCSPLEMVQSFSTCWDSLVPMNGSDGFTGKVTPHHHNTLYPLNPVALENQSNINMVHYHSSSPLVGSAPSFSCLLNGAYPDNMSNFSLLESTRVSTVPPADSHLGSANRYVSVNTFPAKTRSSIQASVKECEVLDHGITGQEEEQKVENRVAKSPCDEKKRKITPDCLALDSNSKFIKRIEPDQSKGASNLSNDSMTVKNEKDACDDPSKFNAKQIKDQNVHAPKEEYIHIRARRGQATNSHSLAERVRREKISERMRFLQDLVPGCNKVTGKALMLDEIINYVQSLQRQVEFLSMKLATVIPEFDIEGILLKDIFCPDSRSSAVLGFTPNINSSCCPGFPLESIETGSEVMQSAKNYGEALRRSMTPQLFPMDQSPNTWNDELQNIVQTGYVSQAHLSITENDNLKMDK